MTQPTLTIIIALSLITGAAFVGAMIMFCKWWWATQEPPRDDRRIRFRTHILGHNKHHVIF